MTEQERITQLPRTLTEAQERQARVMLIGGRNGDRILKELDALRAAFAQLQADYNSSQQTVAELRADVRERTKWANCGGAPTGKKCAVDGHEIYGAFFGDENGANPICELHGYQQAVRELREQLAEEKSEVERLTELAHLGTDAYIACETQRDELRSQLDQATAPYRELEPCGHAKNFLIGDEYGHFTCTVCQRDRALSELAELKKDKK